MPSPRHSRMYRPIVHSSLNRQAGAEAERGPQALAETDLHEVGPGRYEAFLPETWTALQGVHGGFVASLAVRAVNRTMADPSRTLRAATFGFIRGVRPGPATFCVEEVRIGRSLTTHHISVAQSDGPPSVVGRLHLSSSWAGVEFSDVKRPALIARPPTRCTSSSRAGRVTSIISRRGCIRRRRCSRVALMPVGWRGRDPHPDRVDAAWLTMLGDYFPPAVAVRNTGPSRAVSIEYGIQIHTSAEYYPLGTSQHLACEMRATHAASGFAVEDGTIWAPDGTLLATVRQTRLAG
jgi:acyl-CoA thioesterase